MDDTTLATPKKKKNKKLHDQIKLSMGMYVCIINIGLSNGVVSHKKYSKP
jgi:hypothetical protein